jgi:phosphate transport system permease protein
MTTEAAVATPAKPTFTKLSTSRRVKNNTTTIVVWAAFLLALIPLIWVVFVVVTYGIGAILNSAWWSQSLNGLLADEQGGGVYHAIYGTLVQGLVCAIISVPIGVMVAIYLVEYGSRTRLARTTTFMVDILTGVPSIVAALFIYAVLITTLGWGRSAFAVSLALVLLMVPVVVRSSEEMLKIVPSDLREASYALGVPKWRTIVSVVIPTALSGMITGVMLALARVLGETAPVLILVAYAPYINYNVFGGNMASLPLLMTVERNNPTDAGFDRIWGSAITLILIITIFQVIATVLSIMARPKTK